MSSQVYNNVAKPNSTWKGFIKCKGCQMSFRRNTNGRPEMAFFVHCVEQCTQFQDLGLVYSCDCGFKFITKNQYNSHKNNRNPLRNKSAKLIRPNWLSIGTFEHSFIANKPNKGCP